MSSLSGCHCQGSMDALRRKGRYIVVVLLGLWTVFMAGCDQQPPVAFSRPILGNPAGGPTCETPTHDWGMILSSKGVVEDTFNIANRTDAAIQIQTINTGCGCVSVGWPVKPIPPGEQGDIKIQLDVSGRQGKNQHSLGVVWKSQRTEGVLPLKIKYEVQPSIQAIPAVIDLGRQHYQSLQESVVQIRSYDPQIAIKEIHADAENARVQLRQEVDPLGRYCAVHVQIQEPVQVGKIQDTVLVWTTDRNRPVLTIPVQGVIYGDIEARPCVIDMKFINFLPNTLELEIIGHDSREIKSVKIISPENIQYQLTPQDGKHWKIVLRDLVPDEALVGQSLQVYINEESRPALHIPFIR